MNLSDAIFKNPQPHEEHIGDKVSIIGAGMVGMAAAVCLLGCGLTKNLVLIDIGDKVKGEILDLQHGSLYLKYPKISGGNDFSLTQGSKLCIITAGVRQQPGESRLSLSQRNADIVVKMIPDLVKYSPETVILVVGNPCDVLAYVAWKVSGLPQNRVIGAGTTLDSQRLKYLISQRFGVNPANIHSWVIGEHGDNSMVLWSNVNLSGIRIKDLNPLVGTAEDPERWVDLHKEVKESAADIQDLKGYTNWGIGMSISAISRAILGNRFRVYPVSVNAKGMYGITDDVFIPLPAVLGMHGVYEIINVTLSEEELMQLRNTASLLKEVQDGIHIKGLAITCRCRRCRT